MPPATRSPSASIPHPAEIASARIYGEMSPDFGEEIFQQYAQYLKVRTLRRRLRAEDRALDVGCGNGLYMRVSADRCREIVGVDITPSWIAAARVAFARLGISNCRLSEASAMALPFPDETFDLTYSFSTLLLVPDIRGAVSEMARVLRPGGIAVFDVSNTAGPVHRHWSEWYKTRGHPGLRGFTWTELRDVARDLDLRIVEARAFGLTDRLNFWKPTASRPFWGRVFHHPRFDLDHLLSGLPLLKPFANRWYVVARKKRGRRIDDRAGGTTSNEKRS